MRKSVKLNKSKKGHPRLEAVSGAAGDTCRHASKAGDGQALLALNSAGLSDFQQTQCAAEVDSTAPETATPTWGAADTRVQAAFQEAKKKKKKEKKERKRRDSGEQGSGRRPQRRALASRRSRQAALGARHSQVAQTSDPAAGRALPAGGDLRCVSRPRRSRH